MLINNVAMIGTGAVGGVYARHLYNTYGNSFYIIAEGARKERIEKKGIKVNGTVFNPQVVAPNEMDIKMDLIILAVKNYDLEQALSDITNMVKNQTIMLPLLNGITASERISKAFPKARTLLGLSMGIDAIRNEEGIANTDDGMIQFGYEDNTDMAEEVKEVMEYLTNAGIASKVFPDMKRMLWRKWMLNVGVNQASAITGAKFKYFAQNKELKILFRNAMLEVFELAKVANVNLTMEDITDIEKVIYNFTPEGKTSMLQDADACRRTEIDYFAGTVIEYGKTFNVPTPVNEVLFWAIKSKEKIYMNE
ncbi:MAG: ketopantoate reductase family protein [Lachnotalea sp.]